MTELAGYTQLPGGAVACGRKGSPQVNLQATRIIGHFLVRGKAAVQSVNDGWVVKAEDGYLLGVEVADFNALFNAPPSLFVDSVVAQTNGQEGVAYSQQVLHPDNGSATVVSASLSFGSVYDGLTLNVSDPTNIVLSGTPALSSPRWSYFEIGFVWDDGKSACQRYCMSVLPA